MSFNLKKNEQPEGAPKKSTFDLSKKEVAEPAPVPGKRSNWPLIVIALLLAVGAAVYLMNRGGSSEVTDDRIAAAEVKPSVNAETAGTPGEEGTPAASSLTDDITSNPGAESVPETSTAPKALTAASFDAGSAELQGIDEGTITQIQNKLKSGRVKVEVRGYASSEGALGLNRSISQARADAFKRILVENGIPAAAIEAIGKGIADPVASNDTEEGRGKNRRVAVSFVE